MRQRLVDALKHSTADYAEIRYELNDATTFGFRGENVENLSSSQLKGGIVRACKNGGWGTVVFDSVETIEQKLKEACQVAGLVGKGTTELAYVPPVQKEVLAEFVNDYREVPIEDKIEILSRYNHIILKADPAIASSRVAYTEKLRTVYFASTDGTWFLEQRPSVVMHASAIARDGSLIQTAHESISSTNDINVIMGLDEKVRKAADRAAALLKAPPVEGGNTTVLLNPRMGGVFVHEAFGHLSEADFIYENPKMRDLMTVGKEMGTKQLNVIDDGSLGTHVGTYAFDDEGTPTGPTYLINEGVLSGHLHSRETAGKMDAKPTGNARAIGRQHVPIVRMTNTYIDQGDQSFDELIAGIDDGVYACDMIGGQTMMEMFTFSAAHGYRIKNGKLGELVRDITLSGNVFQTLQNIDGFGDDLQVIDAGGGCGKAGQSPLPVSFGAPHLRIQDVLIGG